MYSEQLMEHTHSTPFTHLVSHGAFNMLDYQVWEDETRQHGDHDGANRSPGFICEGSNVEKDVHRRGLRSEHQLRPLSDDRGEGHQIDPVVMVAR